MLPDRISVSDEWVNELSAVKGVKSVDLPLNLTAINGHRPFLLTNCWFRKWLEPKNSVTTK